MRSRSLVLVLLAFAVAPAGAQAALTVRGSAEQVQVTGATPGARLRLLDARGATVATRAARSLGGVVFRSVKPGAGYRVRQGTTRSRAVTVFSTRPTPPTTGGYRQTIPKEGYGYLTTRDGTKLAINVHLPSAGAKGPFPTLIEYSGYGYARPPQGESSIAQIANLLGYAVVDVNMRGTGCSGGAFDYFEDLQRLDGYDVIETVARQPWAMHHRVGMMGISYGGISQLFVGATRPPNLSAITPLSVLDDSQTTLYPGGILNTGFALNWTEERDHDARPASPTGGQPWARQRIAGGDTTCKRNQALHADAVSLVGQVRSNRFYRPAVADPLSPRTFVNKIDVPVFLACQWTDEQTGGHCPALASRFTGTKRKWFAFTNGTHIDSLDPATFNRWFDFLELYVARRAPRLPAAAKAAGPLLYETAMGVKGVQIPDDPIQSLPTTFAAARAAYERLPQVRIRFDNGAGGTAPGQPVAGFERSFSRWPIPTTRARSWWFGAHATLTHRAPAARSGADGFTWDKRTRTATDFTGDTSAGKNGLWTATPPYHWTQPPGRNRVSYLSAPLKADTTVVGGGSVEVWVQASVPDVDLQATVSEVRPDRIETFVQNGWLRTSLRALDARTSTLLEPRPTFRRADAAPLPRGRWAKVTVPLYYQGHAYRAGSRIQVTIEAPSGDQAVWSFAETVPKGTAKVGIARSRLRPSRLVLPVVGGSIPTPLPPCPGLRGEPCRRFTAAMR